MAAKKRIRKSAEINGRSTSHPYDWLLNFWRLNAFADSWEELGLTDDDLATLEIELLANPRAGQVMQGTNGLRKMRFSPRSWKTGKSGALRVCYVYFQKYGLIVFVLVFRKSELDNLSDAGKKAVGQLIDELADELARLYGF